MNISKISRLVLAMGSTILVYALFIMDVTADGRIVNLNLLNIRQNLVIVGALMVLVGTILMAASIASGKAHVPEDAPKAPLPPGPNPVTQLLKGIWTPVQDVWQRLNSRRPGILLRVAWALICTINLAQVMPVLPWQLYAIGLAIFLPLSLRNLPKKIAVSKTCFWAVAVTLPLNLIYLSAAISNMDLPITMATNNVVTTLALLGCYFIFKRK